MSSHDVYDRQGNKISYDEWARRREGELVVDNTTVGEVTVSTVWLGLDHSFVSGPPVIFETMLFGGAQDGECERYSTEAEAIAGHQRWVEKAQIAYNCTFAGLA